MSTLILTHAYCVDGQSSDWVIRKVYPLARSVHCQYGMRIPDVTDYDVVIADFSFSRSVMLDMAKKARSILCLDHHKSAENEIGDLPFCTFDMKRSGAGLAWDHFFPDVPRPALINYVEDRDLWNNALPHIEEVTAVIQSTPYSTAAWTDLADRLDTGFDDVVHEGTSLLRYQTRLIERASAAQIDVVIAGYRVPSVNSPLFQTELGNEMDHGMPFAAAWYVTKEGRVRFSLRSAEPDGLDVAEIARLFGGGGHVRSSGFEVDLGTAMTMFSPGGLRAAPYHNGGTG